MKKLIYILAILTIFRIDLSGQDYIRSVIFDRQPVFDTTANNNFLGRDFLNSLHWTTRTWVIDAELLFERDFEIFEEDLYESERNLRSTGLFTDVAIYLDSVGINSYDVVVKTNDRWSFQPALLFGLGGGASTFGAKVSEFNLLGTGTTFEMEAMDRTENNIGLQGGVRLYSRRVAGLPATLNAFISANRYRTDKSFSLMQPFYDFNHRNSFGVDFEHSHGADFLYDRFSDSIRFLGFQNQDLRLFYSRAWRKDSRVFVSALLELNNVTRAEDQFRRAFDNSGRFLVSFSSSTETFYPVYKLNSFQTEDISEGGYGAAILGRIFNYNTGGESMFYAGIVGERSYYDGKNYFFGHISAGSGFFRGNTGYTYQEFRGKAFHRINENQVLALNLRQQTVWRWSGLRQLVLDNDSGLRGYNVNEFAGDNRIIANLEYRVFPNFSLSILDFSGVAFVDGGTVWDRGDEIFKSRSYWSAGLGLRVHNSKSTGDDGLFRIDFAWNFNENKFGGIIFTTGQLFSLFNLHSFRLPQIFGLEFDAE